MQSLNARTRRRPLKVNEAQDNLAAVAVVVAAAAATVVVKTRPRLRGWRHAHPRTRNAAKNEIHHWLAPKGSQYPARKQRRNRMAAKSCVCSSRSSRRFASTSLSAIDLLPPAPQSIVLHPPRARIRLPVPVRSCNGEFDLAAPVTDVASQGHDGAAGHTTCKGERVRGRLGKTPCDLDVKYSIALSR